MKNKLQIMAEIMKKMMVAIPETKQYNPEGVFYSFIRVVALFIEKFYVELKQKSSNRFMMTSRGKYLDMKVGELSITRYPAVKTRGFVVFTRKDLNQSITINKDKMVSSKPNFQGEILRYKVVSDITFQKDELSINVLVEAEEAGSKYNLVENQINEITTPISGVIRVSNTMDWIVQRGTNIESDESLRRRYVASWQGLNGANKQSYIYWLKQIPEVEDVMVVPIARGLGTVDVIFTKTNNQLPDNELIAKVQKHIEEKKPISSDVQVKSPIPVTVDVMGDVILSTNSVLTRDELERSVYNYFENMKIGYDFEPSSLSGFLFRNCKGIKSISLNVQKITISEFQIASLNRLNMNIISTDPI